MAELDDGADGVVATVIIDTYPGAPEGMRNRPLLEKSAADFVELAAALGFRASHCDLSGSGEDRGARRAISDGFGRLDQHPATRKIVYWTGHGKMLGREFYLVPSDGHRDGVAQPELSFNVTTVAQMVSRLSGEVLLILDACFSATALDEVTRIIRSMGRQVDERGRMAGFAVVATAEAEAGSGEWVRCLQQVMGNRLFRQPNEDKPLFMRTERYIGVGDLLEALSASTGWTRGSQVQGWQEIHPLSRTFLRNPYFSESMRRAVRPQGDESWIGDELRKDVMRPFSGTSDLWSIRDFTGRTASVRRIVTWLGTRSRGMFVVTGPSGSGKSALLSYVAHLTIPEFYERLRVKPPLYLQPDLHSIHAAVHCRGKTISGLVNELAARLRPLGLEGDSFATPEEFTAAVARMAELKGALTLLVDGLDEAATGQSFEIARDLLNRLAACPAIKVVVGTRYLPRQLPAGYHVTETLVEVLHTSEEPLAIDEDPGTDTDIHRYVDHVLRSEGSPYRTADDERAHACASLTVRSHGLFIIASMWAHHLARQSERPALNRLDSDIGSGLAELNSLMAEEVRRLDPIDPERTQDLLRPLALAQGAGLPCSQVWLEIANALRAGSRAPYTYKELRRVVHGTVKTLVSMENEDGRDLYRLHHLSFGAHLLPREEDQPELHRRIVDVLRPSRHGDGNGTWEKADPYIKNQMAAHAAAAGDEVLDELTSDLDFLVNADPAGVLPLVGNASQVSEPLQLYLRVVTRFARLGVRERWALMRATALRSHPELLHEMRPYETSRLPWDDVWTDAPPEPVYRTLVGPFGGAHAVTWTDAGGNLVLASGISEIRAWHASSGHVAWTLQRWADASSGGGATGEEGPLSAIGMIDDTPVVVAADARALLLWSTSFSRRPQRMFWGGDVKSVSVTSKGADAYAAALEGDMLWVWHWPLNAQSQPRRIHHVRLSGPARAVRLVPLAGALIAVIGGRGRVELREVTKGARNHAPLGFLETGTVSVDDVAVLSEPDGTAWIAAVGWQRLRVWRLRKLPFEENPLPVLDIVTSGRGIALGRGRGGILAAVKDGTEIRTWQMDGTEHVPLTHHDTMLKSIAFDPSGSGRLAAADGGSVRIWEPGDTTLQRAAVRSALHLLRVFPGTRDRHLLCRAEGPRVRISEHTMAGRSRRWSSEEVVLDHTPDKVAEISAVSLADNTWLIATAFRRTVRLWTVVNGEVTHRHEISLDGPRDDGIRAVALHTDGDMVQLFVPVHQRLRTYRLDTAENVWRPAESTASVTGAAMIEQIAVVACLDNEPYVVARAGASAYLWHGGPHPVSRIDVPIGPMSALGCGRSSVRPPLVAISVGSEIFLSEFRDGRRSAEPLARSATAVRSLALTGSSEHPLLVAGTGPSTVRLWDPIRRRPLLDIPDRGYLVEQVAAVTNHRGVTLFLAGKDRCDQLHLPTARIEALAHIENGEPHAL